MAKTSGVDTSQLNSLIVQIENFNLLEDTQLMDRIVERGVELLKEETKSANFKFGNAQDIVSDMQGQTISSKKGILFNNNPKMAFIEYGTGITGKGTSKVSEAVLNQMGWKYNEKETGWWYPVASMPPEGQPSFYDENKRQWYAWTRGQEAKNIFYNATLKLKNDIPNIIKEVIENKR